MSKKVRKILSVGMMSVMMFGLVACGNKTNKPAEPANTKTNTETSEPANKNEKTENTTENKSGNTTENTTGNTTEDNKEKK